MTVLLDVNETLLDLGPIRAEFAETHGDPRLAGRWFAELLRLAFVSTIIGRHRPFTDLAGDALDSVTPDGASNAQRVRLVELIRTLPPHPDVAPGLDLLRAEGHTVAAVTNSPTTTVRSQLTNAGLIAGFDLVMSVDEVEAFKPDPRVYRAAADRLGASTSDCVMIAAHDWDIAGATAAGCRGIFLERRGATWSRAFGAPTHRARDLVAAARWISATG